MIYAASLGIPVKQSMPNKALQSTLPKIISNLNLDPATTTMDVVVLGPKDAIGPKAQSLNHALSHRHPDICVIYIYTKESEEDLIDCENKKRLKKIKAPLVREAISMFLGEHTVRTGKASVQSADFQEVDLVMPTRSNASDETEDTNIGLPPMPSFEEMNRAAQELETAPGDIIDDIQIPAMDTIPLPDLPMEEQASPSLVPLSTESVTQAAEPVTAPKESQLKKIEDYITNINSYEDWSMFKTLLDKDAIVKRLIEENSEFVGLVNILDVLDNRIQAVFRNPEFTAEQRFEKIKEIGLERAVRKAAENSIYVDKVINIMSAITLSAKRTVESKLASIDTALYKITTDKKAILDSSNLDKMIEERSKVQFELLSLSRDVVDLYKQMDLLVTDEIRELDSNLPSSNVFINELYRPIGTQIFTPTNTAELTNKLLQALQQNRITASQLEESINAIIQNLFQLCNIDEDIITQQQRTIELLKAHRVEDVVIVDTVLKESLRLYVGADNTGRSATAITWCGIMSRRNNVLLLDLTGRAKFETYGITPIPLSQFMSERIERPFTCVASDRILTPEELQNVVAELKTRLNYYPFINVILAPEDEAGIDQLSEDAKVIHYITDCTTHSIDTMHNTISKHTTSNIARKLITIDAPVSPLLIAEKLGIDPCTSRIIMLPPIPAIRACAIKADRPYEYEDITHLFEEAFR